jgi:hypothetical protein
MNSFLCERAIKAFSYNARNYIKHGIMRDRLSFNYGDGGEGRTRMSSKRSDRLIFTRMVLSSADIGDAHARPYGIRQMNYRRDDFSRQ